MGKKGWKEVVGQTARDGRAFISGKLSDWQIGQLQRNVGRGARGVRGPPDRMAGTYLAGNKGLYGDYNTCLLHLTRSYPAVTSDTPILRLRHGKA
jgi:hypothetical protein